MINASFHKYIRKVYFAVDKVPALQHGVHQPDKQPFAEVEADKTQYPHRGDHQQQMGKHPGGIRHKACTQCSRKEQMARVEGAVDIINIKGSGADAVDGGTHAYIPVQEQYKHRDRAQDIGDKGIAEGKK